MYINKETEESVLASAIGIKGRVLVSHWPER